MPSWLRLVCQCFVERQLRACSQIFKGTRCWKTEKPKRFWKVFCPFPMKLSELTQGRCSLFRACLELYIKEVWKSVLGWCFSGLHSRKENRKEDEVENVVGSIFCKKENTNESNNECTNPLLILLFHMNNCPEFSWKTSFTKLEGLLVLYVLFCPSLIFLLSWRVLSLIVNWQSMYMS